ncbi:hypothetical protein HY642_02015 [Candidatus Woesearchaeota archaeon]|nr:hypothetical protein [Candidatus Woesearchaeota archaeon]
MLVRKLVQSGPSSFTVALPRTWIRSRKLSKGDLLGVEALPDKVIITPASLQHKRDEGTDVTIVVDNKEFRTVQRDIRAAYLTARRIILTGRSLPEKLDLLRKEANELVALEVVDESRTTLVLRNFVNLGDVSVPNLLRRVDNIVRSMLLDMPSCLDKPELAQAVKERDFSVNRLGYLILKCMKTALHDPQALEDLQLTPADIIMYWELNVQIEKIGDEAKRIARLLPQHKKRVERAAMLSLLKQATEAYQDSMKSFYLKDARLSDDVALRRFQFTESCDKYLQRHQDPLAAEITGKLKGMMSHISDITRLVRYLAIA